MPHLIIGTAGHIDHGKSSLVRCLTGTDPDRLPAEKERGMTIDLGYAHFDLPTGQRVGIVDVPGHERFVKNMLAGATGVDFALLVIAADDSVMPQTREHLQILELLEISRGIVVVTKIDLVDKETLELVEEEVRELLEGRRLENAPILFVSCITGLGIPELKEKLAKELTEFEKNVARDFFRLAVDRSFSKEGFGCVVTGTVASGKVQLGDEVELLPQGERVKIRGIQVHGTKAETAEAGQRAALNLAGVKRENIQRGSQISVPGLLRPSRFLAAEFLLLPEARQPLKNFTKTKLHLGTVEAIARIVFLDRSARLAPGEAALVQFRLEEPVVADRNDRFVVRAMSPQRTLGGGRILYVGDEKISRFQSDMLHYLRIVSEGDSFRLLEAELLRPRPEPPTLQDLATELGLSPETVHSRLKELGSLCVSFFEGRTERFVHRETVDEVIQSIERELSDLHCRHPILLGMTLNNLRRAIKSSARVTLLSLARDLGIKEGKFELTGNRLHLEGRQPQLDKTAKAIRQGMIERLKESPFETPRARDLIEYFRPVKVAEEVYELLVQSNEIAPLTPDVILLTETLEEAKKRIRDYIQAHGEIRVKDLRDELGTSRKYALPLLEYLDSTGFTQRVGDVRVLTTHGEG